MRRKTKLLDQNDVKEVVRFQEYLRDYNGTTMPDYEFALKYADYLGLSLLNAVHYSHLMRKVGP